MRYELGVVSYFDILGFRELVESNSADSLEKILRRLSRYGGEDGDPEDIFKPSIIAFSDCVVRVAHLESPENVKFPIGLLFHEILRLGQAQMDLANEGILLRGGLTIGKIAIEDQIVFGPALIEAYELETRVAQYPRIVIAPRVFNALRENHLIRMHDHTVEQEEEEIRGLVADGSDGIHYIDYLRLSFTEVWDNQVIVNFLRVHRKLILSGCQTQMMSRKHVKYLWLAKYHNDVVAALDEGVLVEHNASKEELTIQSSDCPGLMPL